jgi:ubiquinone biosynthesis protein UbiJ
MKHTKNREKYDGNLTELAEDLGNLRYDALAEFLGRLSAKIAADGAKDAARGRHHLGKCLQESSERIAEAMRPMEQAWRICEPKTH